MLLTCAQTRQITSLCCQAENKHQLYSMQVTVFNMLLDGFCANTDLPPYRFLQRTTIRIKIGSKYACVNLEQHNKRADTQRFSKKKVNIWCSGRDSDPGLRLERPEYLTGLYYRSAFMPRYHANVFPLE